MPVAGEGGRGSRLCIDGYLPSHFLWNELTPESWDYSAEKSSNMISISWSYSNIVNTPRYQWYQGFSPCQLSPRIYEGPILYFEVRKPFKMYTHYSDLVDLFINLKKR